MAPQRTAPVSALIQSHFSSSPTKNSDGFTTEEVQSALCTPDSSTVDTWTPTQDYYEADLGSLEPGPRNLALMGRVVNLYDSARPSKSHRSAQGCLKIMLADDTGVLTVRLWYAKKHYAVKLGQLVTIWTVHISNSSSYNTLAPSSAPLFTSIFPEGEQNCHFMVHVNSDSGTACKRPFGCKDERALSGLMTLRSFVEGGFDLDDPRVLVCVKSIGARKGYLNKDGTTSDLIHLAVFDNTADASLTLYGTLCDSASSFKPSQTVLLISSPGWRLERIARLSINGNSRVDVDPDLADARRLRALAQRLTKKEHVNPPFPGVETDHFEHAPVRALYTLADVDEFARRNAQETPFGYINVIITQLNIVTQFKRNMLLSDECCGIPVFANSVTTKCKQCDKTVKLRLNPRILGPIIDETGQIASGKLILSDQAWEQLLGRKAEQVVVTDVEALRYLEQRLLFLRVTMGFVLSLNDEIGRLAIWCVKN